MTTPLLDEVTRRTALTVDEREVEVTLVPGDVASATPEAIRFHLVGMKTGDRTIPLPMLLRLAGYDVKLPKLAKGVARLDPAAEIRKLFETSPELQALEAQVQREQAADPGENGSDLA
jgi:hypothetical protein